MRNIWNFIALIRPERPKNATNHCLALSITPWDKMRPLIEYRMLQGSHYTKLFSKICQKWWIFWILIRLIDSKCWLNAFNHGIPNWLTKRLYEVIIQIQTILRVPLHVTDKTLTKNVLQNWGEKSMTMALHWQTDKRLSMCSSPATRELGIIPNYHMILKLFWLLSPDLIDSV